MGSEFHPFQPLAPSQGGHESVNTDATRWNMQAIVAMLVMGAPFPGWSYTNSFTRGEAAPGTAIQPARAYLNYGAGATKVWVRAVLTWDAGGNPTKIAFSWSDDNEQSYIALGDTDGNSFLNVVYDGAGNVASYTWGKA